MERVTAYFTGRVQGVGFRYTTARLAKQFAVAGYVMNLPDGRVELVVEGEPAQVRGLLDAVKEKMGCHIRDTRVDRGLANGEYGNASDPRAFGIRH